ncbi:MAG: LPS export ABC transporter permease LptG [Methylococcales bacterium]
MNVLTGYIVREILKGSLVALLLLLTLFDLFTFSDELKDLGKGSYGLKQIIYYVLLTSPTVIYELMPASALLGCLFILGAMGNNRELTAMQSAGVSVFGIIKSALLAGAVLVFAAVLIGETIAPLTERAAQTLKVTTQNEQIVLEAKYGLWLREGKSFINVRQIKDDGSLADISSYELNDKRQLQKAMHADRATYLGKQQWKLTDIKQSHIFNDHITADAESERTWQSSIAPDLLEIVVVKSDNLSIFDLAKYVYFLKQNHQKSQTFELALWGRVVNPLVTFIMILVSAPFVIGIRRGMNVGGRMMIGVVIGMSFNIIDKIVGHIGLIYDLNPPLMAFLPSVTVFAIAIFALRRVN